MFFFPGLGIYAHLTLFALLLYCDLLHWTDILYSLHWRNIIEQFMYNHFIPVLDSIWSQLYVYTVCPCLKIICVGSIVYLLSSGQIHFWFLVFMCGDASLYSCVQGDPVHLILQNSSIKEIVPLYLILFVIQ